MADKDDDDLDATVSFRISTKERARLKELADANDIRPTIGQVARGLLRRALLRDDGGGGLAA